MKRDLGLLRRTAGRAPVVHFLVLGALLYGVGRWWPEDGERPRLVVSGERLEHLRAGWIDTHGREPSAEEEASLLRRAAEEELLFREALALGLERGDRTVRFRLARNMRFLGYGDPAGGDDEALCRQALEMGMHESDPVVRRYLAAKMKLAAKVPAEAEPALTDSELRDYLERHRERWQRPTVARLSHVFLNAERRGDALAADAARTLERLREPGRDLEPDEAAALGDPFPLGWRIPLRSRDEIARTYGDAVADAAMTLAPGAWQGPFPSSWGLHLLRVEERRPARLPELDAVRSQVLGAIAEERRAARLDAFLDVLVRRYEVIVDDRPASAVAAPSRPASEIRGVEAGS